MAEARALIEKARDLVEEDISASDALGIVATLQRQPCLAGIDA